MTTAQGGVSSSVARKIRETVFHSSIYVLGSSATALVGMLLTPLYTRRLGADSYGVYWIALLSGTLAGYLFYFGVSSAIARFYYEFEAGVERRSATTTAAAMTAIGTLLQILLGVAFGDQLSLLLFETRAHGGVLALAFASSAVTFLNQFFIVLLRFEKRSVAVVSVAVTVALSTVVTIVALMVYTGLGLAAPFAGTLLVQAGASVGLIALSRQYFGSGLSSKSARILMHYGAKSVLASAALWGLSSSDRFVINQVVGSGAAGIYSLGYMIAATVNIGFVTPVEQIYGPLRVQYRNADDAIEFFKLLGTYYFIAGTTVVVCVSVFASELVQVIAGGGEFQESHRLVPWFMAAMVVFGASTVMSNGVYYANRVLTVALLYASGAVLSVTANYLLLPRFGLGVAVITYFSVYLTISGILVVISARDYPVVLDRSRVLGVVICGIATITLGDQVSADWYPTVFLLKAALLATFCLVTYRMILRDYERAWIRNSLNTLRATR